MGTLSVFKTALSAKKALQEDFYRVSFVSVPTGVGFGPDTDPKDSFDIWCQGTDLPGRKLSVLEIKKHNFSLRMPDRMEYDGSWKTTVLLDMSLSGYQKLMKWQENYSNFGNDVGGNRGFPVGTAEVQVLDNLFQPNGPKMRIYGIFPSEVPAISFKQDSSNVLTVDVTFTYSYCTDSNMDAGDPLGGGNEVKTTA